MISPRDTIVVNDSVLEAFRHSRNYDYTTELVPGQKSNYFDRLWHYLEDSLDMSGMDLDLPEWGWWCLGGLVLLALCYLIYKHRVNLFGPRDKGLETQEITEDDINEVDFDQLISEAEKNGDYLMLCRLRYLQTLKAASDASLVTWRRYKTPSQYAMEWPDADFGVLTKHFLRIRYGHYTASAALAEEMRSRQAAVQARIASNMDKHEQPVVQQEGGEQS